MFKPTAGAQDVIDWIAAVVKDAGADACPPFVVGVGIGGDFELSCLLSKKALLRKTDQKNNDKYYADLETYHGLNGVSWLQRQFPEQYDVIVWFNKNVSGQPVILEAPGDSYTDFNVISAYTGLPTVSGWFVHEWLWRGDSSFPQARVSDITQIYT